MIFLRAGKYENGIYKFTLTVPEEYNAVGTVPAIRFVTPVVNPMVDAVTGDLDLEGVFRSSWDPTKHFLVTALVFLKKIFYLKTFVVGPPPSSDEYFGGSSKSTISLPVFKNMEALRMLHEEGGGGGASSYARAVSENVRSSQEKVHEKQHAGGFEFTQEKKAGGRGEAGAHEILREMIYERGREGGGTERLGAEAVLRCVKDASEGKRPKAVAKSE